MAALFTIVKRWKQPKCPSTNKWVNKMWYLHVVKYYSAIKKEECSDNTTTWMNLENTLLSEISQTQKDTYMIPFI